MKKEILHLFERAKREYIENKFSDSLETIDLLRKQIVQEGCENRKQIEDIIKQRELQGEIKEDEEKGVSDLINFGKKEVIKE